MSLRSAIRISMRHESLGSLCLWADREVKSREVPLTHHLHHSLRPILSDRRRVICLLPALPYELAPAPAAAAGQSGSPRYDTDSLLGSGGMARPQQEMESHTTSQAGFISPWISTNNAQLTTVCVLKIALLFTNDLKNTQTARSIGHMVTRRSPMET